MFISGFELFMIGGNNPSNLLASLYKSEAICPKKWAIKFLLNRHRGEAAQSDRDRTFVCPHPEKLSIHALEKWAIVESLNSGSFQRAELPGDVFPFLKGSGRWHAGDRGGWDKLLLEAVLAWMDTTPRRKAEYERVAEYISENPPRGLKVNQEPYRIDRGKLFERMASAIFDVRETVVPDCRDGFEGGPAVVFEVGINKAEVLIGDCLPRWLVDIYQGQGPREVELSDRIDRALISLTEVDDRGLILGCGAPWEFQQNECQQMECTNCIYENSARLTTCSEFMQGMGVGSPDPVEK